MIMQSDLQGTSRMIIRATGDLRLKYTPRDGYAKARMTMRGPFRSCAASSSGSVGSRQLFILELPEKLAAAAWVPARHESAVEESPKPSASARQENVLERLSALWRCAMKRLSPCS